MYAKLFPALQHNNWPRCRPFMRHAISEDVPSNRRGLVTRGYWAWIFAAAGFCADWLTITIMCVRLLILCTLPGLPHGSAYQP